MKQYDLAKSTIFQVAQMNKGSLELSVIQQSLVFSFCGLHTEAMKALFAVTLCKPESAMYMLLGKAQMKAKKIQNAVVTFKRALDATVSADKTSKTTFLSAECHYCLGLCYMEEKSYNLAFDAFSKAVKLYPEYSEAFYQRGLCRLKLQKDKCVQDFNRAIAINPKHYQAYISRAAYYGMKRRYSKAILNCNEAIRIFPNSVRAFLYRGVLKFYNKAHDFYSKALRFDSLNDSAVLNRAITNVILQKFEEAEKDFITAVNLCPFWAAVYYNKAHLHYNLQQYEIAEEDLSKALSLQPNDHLAYKLRADVRGKMGLIEEALKDYNQSLHLQEFAKA